MKYRKKPVVIEAIQFINDIESVESIKNFMGDDFLIDASDPEHLVIRIATLEGIMIAGVGDYIIKGVNGEFYPCKPDIFEKTYELVE